MGLAQLDQLTPQFDERLFSISGTTVTIASIVTAFLILALT
jgi:hypothetical protein